MWATTKPTSTKPVTAITTFLPTMVLHNVAAGLLGHTVGERRPGVGGAWSAAVPASIGAVMDWPFICLCENSALSGAAIPAIRLRWAGSDMRANRDRAALLGSEKQANVIQGHPGM